MKTTKMNLRLRESKISKESGNSLGSGISEIMNPKNCHIAHYILNHNLNTKHTMYLLGINIDKVIEG